jgi:amidase
LLGVPALAVSVGSRGRLRPGVQILAPRFREDLCLDAECGLNTQLLVWPFDVFR